MRYVRRDSELTMLLAQHNNCLALRTMKVFAGYAKMDYYLVCHTDIANWYANRYREILESGECTISYTPNYRLDKQVIGGGHHSHPVKGFFVGTKIYELDVKGQYPSIAINNNFSFDTLNCTCCKYNESVGVRQETIDAINEYLQEINIDRRVDRYWVCRRRKGAYPRVLEQILQDRDEHLILKKKEEHKANPDPTLIEEYQTQQIGAKLFANAGYGLFANEYFEFANYQVAECITAEGRRIHKQMELMAQSKPYNFEVVFGFTDSTFFKDTAGLAKDHAVVAGLKKVDDFIQDCKTKLGVTVELKTVFTNSIFYGKKNRFVAWTGNDNDEPVIKGLDGLKNPYPLWVRKWFERIVVELVRHPETRYEVIPRLIKEAFDALDVITSQIDPERECTLLKFSQRLNKYRHEYNEHTRQRRLAQLLDKDKGDLVHWYETHEDVYVESKRCRKGGKTYSVKPENLNLYGYKKLLLRKLKDSLEITGFNTAALEQELLEPNTNNDMAMFLPGVELQK